MASDVLKPRPVTVVIVNMPSVTTSASTPWSKNSPSGELVPVRRACLPSQLSNDWYRNMAAAIA